MLSDEEFAFRAELKLKVLGLASLERTMAHQRSGVLWLQEGDANTQYFQSYARQRQRNNHIVALSRDGATAVDHADKEVMLFEFYSGMLGAEVPREHEVDLGFLGLPAVDLLDLDAPFSEAEVWAAIKDMRKGAWPGRLLRSLLSGSVVVHQDGCHAGVSPPPLSALPWHEKAQ